MTRINIHIPPRNLCNQHLLAEHREIKRIPNTIRSGKAIIKNIPKEFTLGTGHVKFFYNKLGYLRERYAELYRECKERGFDVSDYSTCFEGIDKRFFGRINFRQQEKEIVVKRIEEKLGNMKNINYICDKVTSNEAIKILNK